MWLELMVLGIALGMNNALAAVALGAMSVRRLHNLRTAILFAVFEALMPILGVLVGKTFAGWVGSQARVLGVIVLAVIGLYSLLKRDTGDSTAKSLHGYGLKTLFLAMALSLDNLTVGFGLGMLNVPLAMAAIVFGSVSLILTLIGMEVGRYIGNRFSISADKLSGTVLLLTAGVMLFR